jgi:hypothetical protein
VIHEDENCNSTVLNTDPAYATGHIFCEAMAYEHHITKYRIFDHHREAKAYQQSMLPEKYVIYWFSTYCTCRD